MAQRYWLLKSDPETFGLAELARAPGRRTRWDGVRNFQARNLLRDELAVRDGALFYHSQAAPPAVVGIARVVRAGYPDPTQFDRKSSYYDPAAEPAEPRWYCVDIELERELERPVTLDELRERPELESMALLRRGNRLSVQPVSVSEWKAILGLARRAPPRPAAGRRRKR